MSLAGKIKCKAIELGFDLIGLTDARPLDARQAAFIKTWLRDGFAGRMDYMHKNMEKRISPAELVKDAQSVIVVGLSYNRSEKPQNSFRTKPSMGKVASYACYEDYHPFIKERLYKLAEFISAITEQQIKFKVCVDSAPTAERALAVRAGLGFIGKNHMLINPELGCRIFLGELITDLKLPSDKPVYCHSEHSATESPCHSGRSAAKSRNLLEKNCSNCNKCTEACPTAALRPDGWFDAAKCVNYLTIEYKGQISAELADKIGNRLFGCEDCIAICPYQKNAPPCSNKQFKYYNDRELLNLQDILSLSEDAFNAGFADSPIKQLGLDRLKRNARICIANQNI